MMLVREKAEDAWFDGSRRYVSVGGQTEGRLYLNGAPVGVNYSSEYMDVAPRVCRGPCTSCILEACNQYSWLLLL